MANARPIIGRDLAKHVGIEKSLEQNTPLVRSMELPTQYYPSPPDHCSCRSTRTNNPFIISDSCIVCREPPGFHHCSTAMKRRPIPLISKRACWFERAIGSCCNKVPERVLPLSRWVGTPKLVPSWMPHIRSTEPNMFILASKAQTNLNFYIDRTPV